MTWKQFNFKLPIFYRLVVVVFGICIYGSLCVLDINFSIPFHLPLSMSIHQCDIFREFIFEEIFYKEKLSKLQPFSSFILFKENVCDLFTFPLRAFTLFYTNFYMKASPIVLQGKYENQLISPRSRKLMKMKMMATIE